MAQIEIILWYLEYCTVGDIGDLDNFADAITKFHYRCVTDWRIGKTGNALVIWDGPKDATDDELIAALLEAGCYTCDDSKMLPGRAEYLRMP